MLSNSVQKEGRIGFAGLYFFGVIFFFLDKGFGLADEQVGVVLVLPNLLVRDR